MGFALLFIGIGFLHFLSGVGNAVFLLRHSLKPELRNPLRAGLAAAVFCLGTVGLMAMGFVFKDRWLGIHLYFIPSPSMVPALFPGDIILVDTWAYKNHAPQLGDIVIFSSNAHEGVLVKRIQSWPPEMGGEGITRDGKYFVMGDNRRDSIDSRRFGGISSTDIQGKVVLIVFSLEADLHLRAGRWLKYPAGLGEG